MAPAMAAMQVGSVIGHLARRSLGQYDLPLPRTASSEILVVTGNLDRIAEEWSLPTDDLRLWLCARRWRFTRCSRARTSQSGWRSSWSPTSGSSGPIRAISEGLLQGIDPARFPPFPDHRRPIASRRFRLRPFSRAREGARSLASLTAAIAAYAEYVTSVVASRLIGGHAPIGEAMRRRRVGRGEGERVAEALFGLRLDQETSTAAGLRARRAPAFRRPCLARLWIDERNLPTPAEVDAPGLWLARITSRRRH